MHRRTLALAGVAAAFAVVAPPASAQVVTLNATDTVRSAGHNGTPSCPDGAVTCGKGTDATLGAYTVEVFHTGPGTQTKVLTFADGSLILDETATGATAPGSSFDSHASSNSDGFPVDVTSSWTVDPASSGVFAGASGQGTEDSKGAGIEYRDSLSGTLTLSS